MIGTDERIYSYTIITTSSAKSVSFLHDRMPVILDPESEAMRKWLDPNEPWSMDLAKILKPYEGELTWSALTALRVPSYNYPFFTISSSCSSSSSF
jgi:putative SOS response-associated peptidase YedK